MAVSPSPAVALARPHHHDRPPLTALAGLLFMSGFITVSNNRLLPDCGQTL